MSINRRRFITIAAGMALATTAGPALATSVVWRGVVLGADAKLVVTGMEQREAKRLIDLALAESKRLEAIFSIYQPHSALSRLNSSGVLESPPAELLSLLSLVDAIHTASGGLFDPTIQPLWAAYAEHSGHPARDVIEQILDRVGWRHVRISTRSIVLRKREMAMTLNGIAQGFITDRIVELLKGQGLRDAVVKMGEISAIGRNESDEPWEVGIANLGDDTVEDALRLSDQSIATSSARGTTFDGLTSHIIHPKKSAPLNSQWQRVSAIHKSAAIADGVSTAGILMNQKQIEKMLEQVKGIQVHAKGNDGKIYTHHS